MPASTPPPPPIGGSLPGRAQGGLLPPSEHTTAPPVQPASHSHQASPAPSLYGRSAAGVGSPATDRQAESQRSRSGSCELPMRTTEP
ncbi:hypothetical protein F751_3936 [Auxenochlorella protothecoides]|uniref:Uncharacterized protein n=1 Tax=Auxenochlorella protothecoides TaxID=3075 RepID=A0A087SHQ2_AUXPR|nr:hypothetical protein F751_3936 [Auxenochlorella protothecoides]KFM25256.1 hypothetical protein F751_3936 [Auxenochlorella protothecoides]